MMILALEGLHKSQLTDKSAVLWKIPGKILLSKNAYK